MNGHSSGRGFKVFISLLLLGIFVELLAVVSVLSGRAHPSGNVSIVEIKGPIEDSLETVRSLREDAARDDVKAIVLRVDSPGGTVGASQEILAAVLKAKEKKPVVVSMGDVAASGGYYVAAGASKILANPGTLTGSIGVIAHFFVLEDLLKKLYLRWEVIKSGDIKDMGSPFHSLSDKERKVLQSMSDDIHAQFIQAVAEGRKMPVEKVREIADGRVVSGRQAKELGLVDELGGLEKAIEVAGKLARISGEPKAIYPERESFGWFKKLAEGKIETPALKVEYRLFP